jgi:hypothetical protein
MNKHHVKPKRAAPAKTKRSRAIATERGVSTEAPRAQPLTHIGSHFVLSETERKIAYALSERGEVLKINTTGPTYGSVYAHNGATALADGASLATVKSRARSVDPTLV